MSETRIIETASLRTDDFEELQDASADWDQRYRQMSPGRFDGGIELARIGARQIFREHWRARISYQGTAPKGAFGFALRLDRSGPATWVGTPSDTDSVILQAPDHEADLVTPAAWDTIVLTVPQDEVVSTVSALSGEAGIAGGLHGVVSLKPAVAAGLAATGGDFLRQAKAAAAETAETAEWMCRSSEQFVKLLLWELVAARDGQRIVIEPARPAAMVRQATELVLSSPDKAIGLTEICTHLGVSLRTLHYAFQSVTGLSPATWLRRIRLNEVHRTLKKSSPGEVQVKRVALENGFLHLGHFCDQYRRFFGCPPSRTLQASGGRGRRPSAPARAPAHPAERSFRKGMVGGAGPPTAFPQHLDQ